MIVFDTETTGLVEPLLVPLDDQPQIIELGAVKLDDATLEEVDIFHQLVNPRRPLPDVIKKITGIRDEDLIDARPFGAHYMRLAKFFVGDEVVVGHNVSFDMSLLEFELERIDRTRYFPWPIERRCTVELTMHLKGHRLKQSELYELVMGKPLPEAHRALTDARNLADVIRELRKRDLI